MAYDALYVDAERAVILVRPIVAVGGHTQHDEARIDSLQTFVGYAQFSHSLRRVVLNQNVADGDQFVENILPFRAQQINGHAALVARVRVEQGIAISTGDPSDRGQASPR